MHEAQLHPDNQFITLTYDDDHLPTDLSLNKSHFQKFMKRYRKEIAPRKIRFFHCGEYGEQHNRPHYHAIIFGDEFPDKKVFTVRGDHYIYTSDTLDKLWGKGYASTAAVTFESACYVARYSMKKINGSMRDKINPETGLKPYERINEAGEISQVQPEYSTMSRRPGIGRRWLERYHMDVYPDDEVVINGFQYKPPRYYDNVLEDADPGTMDQIKMARDKQIRDNKHNATPDRLAVREKVASAKVEQRMVRHL